MTPYLTLTCRLLLGLLLLGASILPGCLRDVQNCQSQTDCFGDEACVLGTCQARPTPQADMMSNSSPDQGVVCPGLALCQGRCVDLNNDPQACGDCATQCDQGQRCDQGSCEAVRDCRLDGCEGLTWCDAQDGRCKPGCERDLQCGDQERCDTSVRRCVCKRGSNRCGGTCVKESPTSCGPMCNVCPTDALGQASCNRGVCTLGCGEGSRDCGGNQCIQCPQDQSVMETACLGQDRCVATVCDDGFEACGGGCAPCPAGQGGVGCDGDKCIRTSCVAPQKLCDGVCATCPEDPNGLSICQGTQCVLICNQGYHECRGTCVSNDDVNSCGRRCDPCDSDPNGQATCVNETCGLACQEGFLDCDNTCASCPTGADVIQTGCNQDRCVATQCAPGSELCDGACAPCPTDGVVAVQCSTENKCQAQQCAPRFLLCDSGCCPIGPAKAGVVDPVLGTGSMVSIAMNSQNFPHIGYYDQTNKNLKHAYWDGLNWQVETVDAPGDVGQFPSIAIDSNDQPVIAYWDASTQDPKLATKTGANWQIERIESSLDNVGQYISLALTKGDTPFVSYYDSSKQNLKVATKPFGAGWMVESVTQDIDQDGLHTSITLDSQENPHVSFINLSTKRMQHAAKTGFGWDIETPFPTIESTKGTSIKLGSNQTFISYHDDLAATLQVAIKTAGTWSSQTADSSTTTGLYSDLAIAPMDKPLVIYGDDTLKDLKFSHPNPMGTWIPETIRSIGFVGEAAALDLDLLGIPHVAYFDRSQRVLMYTTRSRQMWQ